MKENKTNKPRRRLGDRRDGTLLRQLDSMHVIMPIIYPNRCDNEAYISERIDLTPINEWLAEKNASCPDFPYTLFHVITAAMLKTLTQRPKLNRFIANKNMYQRNYTSASFVIKKQFADDSAEGLAFVYVSPEDNIETVHEGIRAQITDCRGGKIDKSSESMDMFNRMPRFLTKSIIRFVRVLDNHGKVPHSLIASDPYYSSVLLSNLGSIKLKCGYHHLTNWGTNSVFCIIGEKRKSAYYDSDGKREMRESVDLGLTIDERLADGYYYSKSIRLLKKLLEEPALLERPMGEKVEY